MGGRSVTTRNVFGPEDMASISRAYDRACALLDLRGDRQGLRAAEVAKRIMRLARAGEADEDRLCALSLQDVAGDIPPRPEP